MRLQYSVLCPICWWTDTYIFCDDNQEEKRLGIEEGLGDIVCYQLVVHSPSSS